MYVKKGSAVAISTKSIDLSHPTGAIDAVTPHDASVQKPINPTTSTNPNVDLNTLSSVQNQMSNIMQKLAQTPVHEALPGTASVLSLPSSLEFTGNPGSAFLTPLSVPNSLISKYQLKLFSFSQSLDHAALTELGDATTPNTTHPYNLNNGDEVVVLVFDRQTQDLVQGAKYTVSTLQSGALSPLMLNDLGLTKAIYNGTATMEKIFTFMDSIQPGQPYTSDTATGEIKNFTIPDGKAMQKFLADRQLPTANTPLKSDAVYAPFIDASMAVSSGAKYDAL